MDEARINRTPATVTVHMQPSGDVLTIPRPKTVLQLLKKLSLRTGVALVIRDGGLLTPDRQILANDVLIVRIATSSG